MLHAFPLHWKPSGKLDGKDVDREAGKSGRKKVKIQHYGDRKHQDHIAGNLGTSRCRLITALDKE